MITLEKSNLILLNLLKTFKAPILQTLNYYREFKYAQCSGKVKKTMSPRKVEHADN